MSRIINFDRINESDFLQEEIDTLFPKSINDYKPDIDVSRTLESIQESKDDLILKNVQVDDNNDEFLSGIYRGVNKFFVAPPKDKGEKTNVGLVQRSRGSFRREINKYRVDKQGKPPTAKALDDTPFDFQDFLFSQTGKESSSQGRALGGILDKLQSAVNKFADKLEKEDKP